MVFFSISSAPGESPGFVEISSSKIQDFASPHPELFIKNGNLNISTNSAAFLLTHESRSSSGNIIIQTDSALRSGSISFGTGSSGNFENEIYIIAGHGERTKGGAVSFNGAEGRLGGDLSLSAADSVSIHAENGLVIAGGSGTSSSSAMELRGGFFGKLAFNFQERDLPSSIDLKGGDIGFSGGSIVFSGGSAFFDVRIC